MPADITWINGPFGGGKTTTAKALEAAGAGHVFDPEYVGYMLSGQLRDDSIADFQDIGAWRRLVPVVAREVSVEVGAPLIAVQTVTNERYWGEIAAGMQAQDLSVRLVVLTCNEAEHRRRIETDEIEPQAKDWRLDHIASFNDALDWLTNAADLVIDTTDIDAVEAARRIMNGDSNAESDEGRA